MSYGILEVGKDPMGAAIADYFRTGKAGKLQVLSSMFDPDEIPVKHLFRSLEEMSGIEQTALQMAHGRILDVGAGSGCHALALEKIGKAVSCIDISPLSVEVMQERGLEASLQNFFDDRFTGQYDTVLMLMNGSGIIGTLSNFPEFFRKLKLILSPDGCVLMDSSDLRYLFENEDGSYDIDLNAGYYGEVDFRMQYKNIKGDSFDWLYVDYDTLSYYATDSGFSVEMMQEGEHYDYLVKISRV